MIREILPVTREQFVAAISTDKADRFAKTFVAKADMQNLWSKTLGAFEEGQLLGAFAMTESVRSPKIANLQLLHTFAAHRGKGVGKELMQIAFDNADGPCQYFRVSAEPDAVAFYEKIGMKFWGKQKSGCQLAMFRYGNCGTHIYVMDSVIRAAVYKKGKGGCVEVFE